MTIANNFFKTTKGIRFVRLTDEDRKKWLKQRERATDKLLHREYTVYVFADYSIIYENGDYVGIKAKDNY